MPSSASISPPLGMTYYFTQSLDNNGLVMTRRLFASARWAQSAIRSEAKFQQSKIRPKAQVAVGGADWKGQEPCSSLPLSAAPRPSLALIAINTEENACPSEPIPSFMGHDPITSAQTAQPDRRHQILSVHLPWKEIRHHQSS